MPGPVRIGVIGCGQISQALHVPDLVHCPDAEVVALCDVEVSKAKALAEYWKLPATTYDNYEDMLAKEQLEGVVVGLPNKYHLPATVAALKAGCHVMVEKPMATSADEAREMVAAARSAQRMLVVNQSQRLYPVHRKAKEVMDSGIMGRVLLVQAMFGHEGPEHWSPTGVWFFHREEARFGAMADLGVHKADLIRYLTGMEVVEVSAYTARLEKKGADVEDNFVSTLRFSDGSLGTLCASWTVKGISSDYVILHCANGTLRINVYPDKPLVAHLERPGCEINFPIPPGVVKYEGSWGIDAGGHFVAAILKRETPFCTGEDAAKSLDVILAAEKSAETGKSVSLGA